MEDNFRKGMGESLQRAFKLQRALGFKTVGCSGGFGLGRFPLYQQSLTGIVELSTTCHSQEVRTVSIWRNIPRLRVNTGLWDTSCRASGFWGIRV